MWSEKQKEALLQERLNEMRKAIDRFYEKKAQKEPGLADSLYYPQSLEELVENKLPRKIPIDPFTEKNDWKTRSSTDESSATISQSGKTFLIFIPLPIRQIRRGSHIVHGNCTFFDLRIIIGHQSNSVSSLERGCYQPLLSCWHETCCRLLG